MIDVVRNTYVVKINDYKNNSKPLEREDYLNIGYMAGRCGINLQNNPHESNPMQITSDGVLVNVNSCTSDLFEKTLNDSGLKFDRLA